MMTEEELIRIINEKEKRNLEFKLAAYNFNKDKLMEYCVGMSNEGGGLLILGVQDNPRKIVGTSVFQDTNRVEKEILDQVKFKVKIEEIFSNNNRVLVIEIPPHPEGLFWHYQGKYLMRVGESLVPMSFDLIQREAQKIITDYSATLIKGSSLDCLDPEYILEFYSKVDEKRSIANHQPWTQRLKNDGLIHGDEVTVAALVMFGIEKYINKYLPQSETTFIYKSDPKAINADNRIDFKKGFWGTLKELAYWITQVYNPKIEIQDHLFIKTIATFQERVVREAILNAFCHREYKLGGSIRINLSAKNLEIISPGGLPQGVSVDRIIYNHKPRNRLIAETLQKCGYVEREGLGYALMWELLTRDSKQGPDLSRTTENEVYLIIHGEANQKFLNYLKRIDSESLSVHQMMILNLINNNRRIDDNHYKTDIDFLLRKNLIERNKYKGESKYILSKQYFDSISEKGRYTQIKSLSDNKYKALILQHIEDYNSAKISDLEQAMPELKRAKILSLLGTLKDDGKIKFTGARKNGVWIKCG